MMQTHYKSLLTLAVLLLLSLAALNDFWAPGLPVGFDLGIHYFLSVEQYALVRETGYWDGLLPQWYLGFSPFSCYPNLFYLLFSVTKFLLTPTFDDVKIYKLVLVSVFYLPIIGSYYFTYSLTRSALFAGVTAVLATSMSVFAGAGFEGHFQIGLVNQTLGLGLYLFCLAFFVQWQQQGRLHYSVLAASAFCLTAQAHIISFAMTGLSLAALLAYDVVTDIRARDKYAWPQVKASVWIWLCTAGVSVGTLVFKVMSYWDERGSRSGWGDINLFEDIAAGKIFSGAIVNLAAPLIVLIGLVIKKGRTPATALSFIAALLFVLGTGAFTFSGALDIFNSVFRHRAWGFAALLTAISVGICLFYIWEKGQIRTPSGIALRAIVLMAVLALSYNAIQKINLLLPKSLVVSSTAHAVQTEDYFTILQKIKNETPKESVIVYELNGWAAQTAFSIPASTLAHYSERVLLQGHQAESSRLNFDGAIAEFNQQPNEFACETFAYTGATHFLTWTPAIVDKFQHNTCFKEIMSAGHFHLFEYKDANYTRVFGAVRVSQYAHSRHHYSWTVHSDEPFNHVRLGFAYHPRFHLRINGQPVELNRAADNFIDLTVPQGQSTISLDYRIPLLEMMLSFADKLLTCVALLSLAGWFILSGFNSLKTARHLNAQKARKRHASASVEVD